MLDTHSAIAAAHALPDPAARLGALTGVMAAYMLEQASGEGSCTETDLLGAGFTSAEIIEISPDARKTASRQACRQVEPADAVNGPVAIHAAFRDLIGCAEEAGLASHPGYARAVRRGHLALSGLAHAFDIRA
jgi:hypothetical protein